MEKSFIVLVRGAHRAFGVCLPLAACSVSGYVDAVFIPGKKLHNIRFHRLFTLKGEKQIQLVLLTVSF